MSVPKYLKRKEGGSQGCLKTGETNDLDSRRLSKRVQFQWRRLEHCGRLRTDTASLLVARDIVLSSTGVVFEPLNLGPAAHRFICVSFSFACHQMETQLVILMLFATKNWLSIVVWEAKHAEFLLKQLCSVTRILV